MPIDKRVRSAAEALADVADGATVFITGFGGAGFPNALIRALRERGPRDLTLVVNSATHRFSLRYELIEAGLVRKVICSAARGQGKGLSPFEQLWQADESIRPPSTAARTATAPCPGRGGAADDLAHQPGLDQLVRQRKAVGEPS